MLFKESPSSSLLSRFVSWVGDKLSFIEKFKKLFDSNNSNEKPKKILLIDEIDVLFNKNYYGDTFNQSIDLRDPSITELFKFIWANKQKNIDCKFV